MALPRPASAAEAVERAKRLIGHGGQYALGTGSYRPKIIDGKLVDVPWTERERDHVIGCDCAGFVVWCYKLPRHRPGFNRGGAFQIEDDINSNSMLGDAMGNRDCFDVAQGPPQIGDVLSYPTIRVKKDDGTTLMFIGHTAIVIGVDRVIGWDANWRAYHQLDIAQCKGPDGRTPAVVATDASVFEHHNDLWPKAQHKSYLLRIMA